MNVPLRLRRLAPIFLLLAPLCVASVNAVRPDASRASLAQREASVWPLSVHGSEFAAVPHAAAHPNCEATRAPEALATPDPLLDNPEKPGKVKVSFIIGTDGRVHSPLVLESAGPTEDRAVLDTVRYWRYRPAMCNGVPTESEAKIEFSGR